jgi:hypothetical protein
MSFQCYTSRSSLRSALTGGLFISADGSRRIIPDHLLTQAELLQDGRLLRLNYSFCAIEISGQCLDPIFEDAGIGKLGAVLAAPSEAVPNGQPWVSGIVIVDPSEAHS